MRKTEFEGISTEDLERFKTLVMDFYGLSWEESYSRLTNEIKTRILRRDINQSYRSHFESTADDLVIIVVSRFARINAKLHAAGQEIHDFYAMLEDRIGHVYHEELRKIKRAKKLVDIDDLTAPPETISADKEMEEEETRALRLHCYQKCFDNLPSHISSIFMEYYDTEGLLPKERTHKRQQMALRIGNLPANTTLEEMKRAKRNLDTQLSKWRKNHLRPCMDKCMKKQFYQ